MAKLSMKTKSAFHFNSTVALLLLASWASTPHARAGSLWKEGITDERGMCADKRAKRVGDILTIIVQENASLSNTLRLKTDKVSAGGGASVAGNLINQFLAQVPTQLLKKALPAGVTSPDAQVVGAVGAADYTGGGEIRNSQTIATRCAVQIIDTLPNGNLVVEGVREVSFSKERQFSSLRGIVRPYDIQPDNTVLSTSVADARIQVVSEGTLTDAQRKGWLLRLNEKISPF